MLKICDLPFFFNIELHFFAIGVFNNIPRELEQVLQKGATGALR